MSLESLQERAARPVLAIGAAGLDMVGVLSEPVTERLSNPASIRFSFGGVARNVAENLARLGHPVRLATAVGEDPFGSDLLEHTASCGVDVSPSIHVEGHDTGSYLAVYDQDGTLQMALEDMQVLQALTPAYIRELEPLFEDSSLIFVDANLPPKTLKVLFQQARRLKVPVCADTTSVVLAERLLPYLKYLFLLSTNSKEASVLTNHTHDVTGRASALEVSRFFVNQGVEVVLIALAAFGVVYATSETSGHVPAIRTKVVDPTGAGDALTATTLFGLLNDIPLDDCVRMGVTAASMVLKHTGPVYPGISLESLYDQLIG